MRVLDNLSNGNFDNIRDSVNHINFEFVEGVIRYIVSCINAVVGIEFISHQAALVYVPKIMSDPNSSNTIKLEYSWS